MYIKVDSIIPKNLNHLETPTKIKHFYNKPTKQILFKMRSTIMLQS